MEHLTKALRNMLRDNPKAAEELMETYVLRPSFMPDQNMAPEDVAYREGERQFVLFLLNLAKEDTI